MAKPDCMVRVATTERKSREKLRRVVFVGCIRVRFLEGLREIITAGDWFLFLIFYFEAFFELGEFPVFGVEVVLLGVVGSGTDVNELLKSGVAVEGFAVGVAFLADGFVSDKDLRIVGFELFLGSLGCGSEFTVCGVVLVTFTGPFQGGLVVSGRFIINAWFFFNEIGIDRAVGTVSCK